MMVVMIVIVKMKLNYDDTFNDSSYEEDDIIFEENVDKEAEVNDGSSKKTGEAS